MKIDKAGVKKILVINLAFIGDVIVSFPSLQVLQREFPGASIDLLVTPGTADIAAANPYVKEIIQYDKQGVHSGIFDFWVLIKDLKARQYDMVLCTNFAIRGAAIAWLLGSKYRVGYNIRGARFLLTHAASPDRTRTLHETKNRLEQLKAIGIEADDVALLYTPDPSAAGETEEFLTKCGLQENAYVVICPAGRLETKRWETGRTAGLIDWICTRYGYKAVLVGGAKDEKTINDIAGKCGSNPIRAAGTLNLRQLPHLLKKARLMISVDTGPMHMAAALGVPLLALFGPTDPAIWGPLSQNSVVLHGRENNMANIKLEDAQNVLSGMLEG